MYRLRIAPSPTGYPHIGTIYQALFDWTFARKHSGQFIIRIEDTDRERFVPDAEERIYQAVDWFNLTENESPRKGGSFAPYKQSERLEKYREFIKELVQKGGAYYCFCPKERLEKLRQDQQKEKKPMMYDRHCRSLSEEEVNVKLEEGVSRVVRLRTPDVKEIRARDEIRGEVVFDTLLIEDTVLIKSDGFPTYHFAATVDDHLMEITHVLRGEEWLSSLPKHVTIYDYFGWKKPLFFHTPVLRNPDKSKLSKRQGHTDVNYYRKEGFLPEAILNFLALLGWSHPEEKEIFSIEEFIDKFDLKDLKAVGPIFDITKLEWMNGEYIRKMELGEFSGRLRKYINEETNRSEVLNKYDDITFNKIISLSQSRINKFSEFLSLANHFFDEPTRTIESQEELAVAASLKEQLSEVADWDKEKIFAAFKVVMAEKRIKMPILYKIITGEPRGLPLPESLELLGKQRTLDRIELITKK